MPSFAKNEGDWLRVSETNPSAEQRLACTRVQVWQEKEEQGELVILELKISSLPRVQSSGSWASKVPLL